MKRLHVFTYEIISSVTEWPVKVFLSNLADDEHWVIHFEYIDPSGTEEEHFSASTPEDFVAIAEAKYMDLDAFANALMKSNHEAVLNLGSRILQNSTQR
jgi:hypothetical protein